MPFTVADLLDEETPINLSEVQASELAAATRRFRERIRDSLAVMGGRPPALPTLPPVAVPTIPRFMVHDLPPIGELLRTRPGSRITHFPLVSNETTYDLITQQSRTPSIRYGEGIRNRWPRSRFQPPYRPAREIPISCQDACQCAHFHYENAPHLLRAADGDNILENYVVDARRRNRREALGETGSFSTMTNRDLVDTRQARALAGIDVSEYDAEITRRVLADPAGWGQLGAVMRWRGWVDEVITEGENYMLH